MADIEPTMQASREDFPAMLKEIAANLQTVAGKASFVLGIARARETKLSVPEGSDPVELKRHLSLIISAAEDAEARVPRAIVALGKQE